MSSFNNVDDKPVGGGGSNSSSRVTATGVEPEEQATIAHVLIKPPEFSDSNAVIWFTILEAQFVIWRVTVSSANFFSLSRRVTCQRC